MGGESVVVGVRLPPDLVNKIDEIAKEEKNPRSAVIRRLLVRALKNGGESNRGH